MTKVSKVPAIRSSEPSYFVWKLERDRLRALRESLATRRRSLSAAKLQPARHSPAPGLSHLTQRETQELNALSMTIARARSGLVQELVEVFNVVEVGGRPPIGGKAGTKGEWTIGDLILPVPGDIRSMFPFSSFVSYPHFWTGYPPDHINAVITHTIHFLSLLTFYLGVKLPFEFVWTGGKLGVGQPWTGAIAGSESGGWARWYTKHPLHLSSVPNPPQPDETPPTPTIPLSESYIDTTPPPNTPSSFTTALAMLLFNVSYLAHTQNVDVPLSQAGDVLSNLWSVCCSAELGRRSHETTPRLSPPTGLGFHLDFAQLLQATAAHPRSTKVVRRKAGGVGHPQRTVDAVKEEEEGWDMVEGDSL
jgi:hypothetical protein